MGGKVVQKRPQGFEGVTGPIASERLLRENPQLVNWIFLAMILLSSSEICVVVEDGYVRKKQGIPPP